MSFDLYLVTIFFSRLTFYFSLQSGDRGRTKTDMFLRIYLYCGWECLSKNKPKNYKIWIYDLVHCISLVSPSFKIKLSKQQLNRITNLKVIQHCDSFDKVGPEVFKNYFSFLIVCHRFT